MGSNVVAAFSAKAEVQQACATKSASVLCLNDMTFPFVKLMLNLNKNDSHYI